MKKIPIMLLMILVFQGSALADNNSFDCSGFNDPNNANYPNWSGTVYAFEPSDAYDFVAGDANTFILDVRTAAEWQWVGHPAGNQGLGGFLNNQTVNIAFKIDYKGAFIDNPTFASDVYDYFGDEDAVLIVMCRSGAKDRAIKASCQLINEGTYSNAEVFYMKNGFEGEKVYGYRTVNGWKNSCVNDENPECVRLPFNTPSPYMAGAYPD